MFNQPVGIDIDLLAQIRKKCNEIDMGVDKFVHLALEMGLRAERLGEIMGFEINEFYDHSFTLALEAEGIEDDFPQEFKRELEAKQNKPLKKEYPDFDEYYGKTTIGKRRKPK